MSGYKNGVDRRQIEMSSLEDKVSPKALARVIDRFIEIVDIEKLGFTRCRPSKTGRPAYPPKALCKLYVYGYENGIRSSRKLERETQRNIEVMWLLDSLAPDYKTISEFRRENIRPLQKLLREFVKLCKSWDLIGGELVAVDGSKIKASNNKKNNFSRKKIDDRLLRMEAKIKQFMDEMESADKTEETSHHEHPKNIAQLQELLERKEQYEEYKRILDESGENELSTVDPDARLMGNSRAGVDIAYNIQSAVDGKHDIVVAYDVSKNPADQHQLGTMVKRVKRILKIRRFTVLADKGYYNGKDLLRVKKLKVIAIVPKQKPSAPKGMPEIYRSEHFKYDKAADTFTCPTGQILSTRNNKVARIRYTNRKACACCRYKADCVVGKTKFRTISRGEYSNIHDETNKRFNENKELYHRRQEIVEHPFGTIKHSLNGGYFLLRTLRKVRTEMALLFLAYNLKRAVKVLGFDGIMAKLDSFACSFLAFLSLLTVKHCFYQILPDAFGASFRVL